MSLEPLTLLHDAARDASALPDELERLYGGPLALREQRLFANFVSTIDGVVAIPSLERSNALISGGSDADRFVMGLLRAYADVVLVGCGTANASPNGRWKPGSVFPPAAEAFAELRARLGHAGDPRVAVVTGRGRLDPGHPVLRDRALVLATAQAAERLDGRLPPEAELAVLPGEDVVEPRAIVEFLRSRGYGRILSEAGPRLFGSLVADGLVDELFLTVSPLLAGRADVASTLGLVEGSPLLPDRRVAASLVSVRLHRHHLFLRFRLTGGEPE